MNPDRWELGSEFHWPEFAPVEEPDLLPWQGDARFHGSGRDSLRALVEHGRDKRGWQRFWVPSYLCQEVVSSIASTGIEVVAYRDLPTEPAPRYDDIDIAKGDALLFVNYFGLRDRSFDSSTSLGIDIVEDHTHDPYAPMAYQSSAAYCVVALRKTLPVAEGGVVWSPQALSLPPVVPLTSERDQAVAAKTSGMILKGLYLAGHRVEKQLFRDCATSGEERIASGAISGMSKMTRAMLALFPHREWRSRRRGNWEHFARQVDKRIRLLAPFSSSDSICPFALTLLFENNEQRDTARKSLIDHHIYPSVLWPLEETVVSNIGEDEIELSRYMLSIHCDMRYRAADMDRVLETLQTEISKWS